MKQRLGVAIALLQDPDLLILDEPANGLDPAGIVEMRDLMHRLSAEGKTVFISSHLLTEVQQICTRVAIIHLGKLITESTVEELTQGQGEFSLTLEGADQALALIQAQVMGREARIDSNGVLLSPAPEGRGRNLNLFLVNAGICSRYYHSINKGPGAGFLAPDKWWIRRNTMSTAVFTPTPTQHIHLHSAKPRFFGTVRGEFFKMARQWTNWIMLALLLGAIVLPFIIEMTAPNAKTNIQTNPLHFYYNLLSITLSILRVFTGIFLLILAARTIGLEYQLALSASCCRVE